LETGYKQEVSLPTIIDRAKRNGFYLKKPRRSVHDQEVLTHYAGELIQHDSSHHYGRQKPVRNGISLPLLMTLAAISFTLNCSKEKHPGHTFSH